jgi:flavin-binding protein dodecin
MPVAKVSEISATSSKSFEDAIQQGLTRAAKTLRNIRSAWIKEHQVRCQADGRVTEYQVNMMVTFVLDDLVLEDAVTPVKKPHSGAFLSALAAPARRALEREGLTTARKLSQWTERDIRQLHGMGPSTIPKLRTALRQAGLKFKEAD